MVPRNSSRPPASCHRYSGREAGATQGYPLNTHRVSAAESESEHGTQNGRGGQKKRYLTLPYRRLENLSLLQHTDRGSQQSSARSFFFFFLSWYVSRVLFQGVARFAPGGPETVLWAGSALAFESAPDSCVVHTMILDPRHARRDSFFHPHFRRPQ